MSRAPRTWTSKGVLALALLLALLGAPATQAAAHSFCGHLLVGAYNTAGRAFEMKPGEIAGESAHQRLDERETHHQ